MNTTTRNTVTALVTILAVGSTAGTAAASTPRGPGLPQAKAATASYAETLAALGGRTLAQYVAEHVERRLG